MTIPFDLNGTSALVTGGAKGIGRAVVDLLLGSGASVRVWDVLPALIEGAAVDQVDVRQTAQIAAALSRWAGGPRIDVLVDCAGYLGSVQGFGGQRRRDRLYQGART